MEQEGKLYHEIEKVRECIYIGDRVSVGEGGVAVVTAITRCGWVKLMEYNELRYEILAIKLKAAVYKSYVWPAILHGSETWQMKESKIGILQRIEIH